MKMVVVLSKDGRSLMLRSNVIARLLLKNRKTKVKRTTPFTIKLTYELEKEYIDFPV